MKKKNPTIGELQVLSGKIMWIIGAVIVLYKLIKSIMDNNFMNEWKGILFLIVFLGGFRTALYFVGKFRIEEGKKKKKKIKNKQSSQLTNKVSWLFK
ncbi:MAG: hypothetical protein ACLUG4_02555 [Bacilli bacterium]|jgi:hypothetical protein|nr:hypothetical protein [Staphylococcus sp.]